MTESKKINWFILTGLTFLLHIILIAISILEVFVYSMAVNPGQEQSIYESHAAESGPWVSGIFGALFTFFFVCRYIRKNKRQQLTYAIAFPVIYIVLDVLILLPFGVNWMEHLPVFLMANGAKVAGAFLAYFLYKDKRGQTSNA